MSYYPSSQIKTNLYTNGGEFSLNKPSISSPQISYTGYYYQTSSGKKYTGKNPQDGPNKLLYELTSTENLPSQNVLPQTDQIVYIFFDNVEENFLTDPYTKITKTPTRQLRIIPPFNLTLPTSQDQSLGVFTRYFCKKNNELKYIEINKQTHDLLKARDLKLAWDLYTPLNVLWLIKGTKEQVFKANKTNVNLIEQRQSWYGFSQYLKEDYLKYYLGS